MQLTSEQALLAEEASRRESAREVEPVISEREVKSMLGLSIAEGRSPYSPPVIGPPDTRQQRTMRKQPSLEHLLPTHASA
jgi:hypothetical protein